MSCTKSSEGQLNKEKSDIQATLERLLEEYHISPISPPILIGVSAVRHTFTAVGKNEKGETLVLDFNDLEEPVDEFSLSKFFLKCYDAGVEKRILICGGASDKAKILAPLLGINLIDIQNMNELASALKSVLK